LCRDRPSRGWGERPDGAPKGKKWADHRKVINAILFRARTGIPWRDLPERRGPWETAAGRHRRWCIDGTWQRIADRLRIDAATGEELIASVRFVPRRASFFRCPGGVLGSAGCAHRRE
jgi:transposase